MHEDDLGWAGAPGSRRRGVPESPESMQAGKSRKRDGAMQILTNTVGRKILMAVSGLFMLFFVIVHLLGNSTIFFGPNALNTYAEKLNSLGPLVWAFRAFMLAMLGIHLIFGVLLTLENWAAKMRWIDRKSTRLNSSH